MKILVAEDEPHLQRSLAQALREANYAVDTAAPACHTTIFERLHGLLGQAFSLRQPVGPLRCCSPRSRL
jgi:DNA-binding response OmpR family regulator